MIDLWFTKEQIEAEENVDRFNSPWDERSFRSRILQDWLTMYAENEKLRSDLVHEQINHSIKNNLADRLAAELEAARRVCELITLWAGVEMTTLHPDIAKALRKWQKARGEG